MTSNELLLPLALALTPAVASGPKTSDSNPLCGPHENSPHSNGNNDNNDARVTPLPESQDNHHQQHHNQKNDDDEKIDETTERKGDGNVDDGDAEDKNKKTLTRINHHPTLTPYRKRTYRALLSVPRGRWTTYSALAKHLRSSARAVGNAMRSNPFAPAVPCHRVLGVDGSLGGYMGTGPGGAGANLEMKRRMLEAEGVRFDGRGRAMGGVFLGFRD